MSAIINTGSGVVTATTQTGSFDPVFQAVTTTLASISAADPNCYKLLIFNPSSNTATVSFVFADNSDTPAANQCLDLPPGTGWLEEGQYTSAHKAIHAKASAACSVLIWKWLK